MNKQTEIQDPTERVKGEEEESNIVGCFRVFGVESPTICTFLPEPMIGHIPFVSSSPSSTARPSLFRDKLVCQNQREWLASTRVISPWNSTRAKLKQQDGSVARIAEARKCQSKLFPYAIGHFFSILRKFNEWQAAIARRHLFCLRELNFAFWTFRDGREYA